MSALKSPFRLGMATLAMLGMLAMPTTSVAAPEDDAAALEHLAQCLAWLLTDLAAHEANCTPSRPFDMPANATTPPVTMIGPIHSPTPWEDCDPINQLCEEPHCDPSTSETPTECLEPCTGSEEECYP